ncbi:ABC transporter permease [Methanosarcina sp.]|uniref:ABC transporter permease n=1 Tax=Methanosarcina sp. TaxID=2213 RepID=UPI002988D32E|nr:ABC transporter permease [Methanosarcina sp.]MDW5551265.1 ABC transporter permease [Methanosarcina sp.]MDW5555167.1 ABC transporter permease [Methanosarcina sp.]MDW5560853.1 ABC transporter permease [Methanosarcina sp.]
MNLNVVLAIFRKDLITSVKNKNLLIILLTPVFLSLLFNSAISLTDNTVVPVAVYDEGYSDDFIGYLSSRSNYDVTIADSVVKSEELLYNQKVAAIMLVPEGFSADIKSGLTPSLNIIVNPYEAKSVIFLQTYKDIIMDFAGQRYPVNITLNMLSGNLQSRFNIPVWIMFTVIFVGMMVLPNTLTTEKEKKTLEAILVSPASEKDVIYGKSLFGLFLTILISLVIIIINKGFVGNFLSVTVFIILGSAVFTGLGLLIASYADNYSSASLFSTVCMAPMILLALLTDLSREIGYISHLVPSTYVFYGIKNAMLNNSGISDLYPEIGALLIFNILVYVLTFRVLKKKRYS